jgi:hypothetical protein
VYKTKVQGNKGRQGRILGMIWFIIELLDEEHFERETHSPYILSRLVMLTNRKKRLEGLLADKYRGQRFDR